MDADYHESRQLELYGALIAFLVLNNVTIAARIYANWRLHYRSCRLPFLEDMFILLSGICVNVVIGNLLSSTHYGLGLHTQRIHVTDPKAPYNMTRVFEHVWISMVLVGPTFTFIKLSLLFFYQRLFLVNQKWLRLAWWINLIYVILWFLGATGFYLFQCWPVQWYWMRFYARYHVKVPGDMKGQCDATTVQHVAMPLIFGLISDVALLLLPITAIWKLQISPRKKLGLAGVFSVGLIACLLELARIIDLEVDTDDQKDPSYGVVIFLILSVAEEVTAILCASLPIIVPHVFMEYKKHKDLGNIHLGDSEPSSSVRLGSMNHPRSTSRGFKKLSEVSGDSSLGLQSAPSPTRVEWPVESSPPINTVTAELLPKDERQDYSRIVVKKEYAVTLGGPSGQTV